MADDEHRWDGSEAPADVQRIVLVLDRSESPLHGWLHSPPRPVAAFTGWIGLLAALETAIGETSAETPASDG
jgi:hypothetical protein